MNLKCKLCDSDNILLTLSYNIKYLSEFDQIRFIYRHNSRYYCQTCSTNFELSNLKITSILNEEDFRQNLQTWWKNANSSNLEIITGFDREESRSLAQFESRCNQYWDNLSYSEKINTWRRCLLYTKN